MTTITPAQNTDALGRWKAGHKAFFVLLQGLVVSLRRFRAAWNAGDLESANDSLIRAAHLMYSCTAVMRYTGDFSAEAYETHVRPTMQPPHTIPGFSGMLSRDHAELLRLIRELRPILASLPNRLRHSQKLFLESYAAVYEAHKYVCERFGGGRSASIRMNETSDKSSVEVLEQFKRNRLRPAEPGGAWPLGRDPGQAN